MIERGDREMSKIDRFEDMDAWKKSRALVNEVYKITSTGEFARDYGLKD